MSQICSHPTVEASIDVHEIIMSAGAPSQFAADVQLRCARCKVRFRFAGVPIGVDANEPRVSPDGFELRAPIVPDAAATLVGALRPRWEVAKS